MEQTSLFDIRYAIEHVLKESDSSLSHVRPKNIDIGFPKSKNVQLTVNEEEAIEDRVAKFLVSVIELPQTVRIGYWITVWSFRLMDSNMEKMSHAKEVSKLVQEGSEARC